MTQPSLLTDATDRELEAFVQLVVLVAYADGDLANEEADVLLTAMKEMTDGRVDVDHVKELMVELPPMSRESNNWRKDRIDALKGDLPDEEMRKEAFRVAVQVAKSDSRIGLRESQMLVNLVTELDIDSAFARETLNAAET